MTDASRAVGVVTTLLSQELKPEYTRKIREEYAQVRERVAARTVRTKRLTYEQALANKPQYDWTDYQAPKPKVTGIQRIYDIDLKVLTEYIDWTPFFISWNLVGKYPRILQDEVVGEAAQTLFDEAQELLQKMTDEKLIEARATFAFWPANQVNHDDIEVYDEHGEPIAMLHHLRQQIETSNNRPNLCLADFVAPKDSGVTDYIGGFIVTAGIGVDELAKSYQAEGDDYNAIMVQALADRLAEACAEWLHQQVRTEYWGYAGPEDFSNDDLIREKYQGIRPAPGYPACPDHTEKGTLFELLDPNRDFGVTITENYAMYPTAAVSGWYFANPNAQYFAVGKIDKDQVASYAKRRQQDMEYTERWLSPALGYEE